MECIQLELNFDNESEENVHLFNMQRQIDTLCGSMGKVRRRIFSELGEMKKMYADLLKENEVLRARINDLKHANKDWVYDKEGFLFYKD